MPKLVLMGDSTLANIAHTGPPELLEQLREVLPADWSAHLCAIDGARIDDVFGQIPTVPEDASHILLSIGGNNCIEFTHHLKSVMPNLGKALYYTDTLRVRLAQSYRRLLDEILELGKPTMVCTVYNPKLPSQGQQRIVETIIAMVNDAIIAGACATQTPVLDLRPLGVERANFVSPIELNHRGAQFFCDAIVRMIETGALEQRETTIHSAAPTA